MASPLNNPWVSGGLGAGIVVYFIVSFTPEGVKQPIRDFFTGELKRAAGREPELKIGTEKLFRAIPQNRPEKIEGLIMKSEEGRSRSLFHDIPKGINEKPVERVVVPEVPEGSGLMAVWMDGETHVAIMSEGQMLREGEPWGLFTVEKITPESVTLRHEAGSRVLRLGEVRAKTASVKAVGSGPKDGKAPVGSAEEQVAKAIEMQKSFDSAKLLKGFPQKILDSLTGNQKTPVDSK
jgi:hypothetical protein